MGSTASRPYPVDHFSRLFASSGVRLLNLHYFNRSARFLLAFVTTLDRLRIADDIQSRRVFDAS
jgi:hypothetical protein